MSFVAFGAVMTMSLVVATATAWAFLWTLLRLMAAPQSTEALPPSKGAPDASASPPLAAAA
jgi:hypothetical protein